MDALLDGRYLPLEERGRGAVASVWRAFDRLGEGEVALKIPRLRAGARGRREILDESVALGRLDHERIVRLLAVESSTSGPLPTGTPYLVLEHLRASAPRHGALAGSPRALAEAALQSLAALRHVHGARLLHGDLKPENLLLENSARGPRMTLIDLGSSTPVRPGPGRYAGSAAWAAPELLLGGKAGQSSDLYSLGRILHHLAGGPPPFDPDDPFGLSRWLLRRSPLRPPAGLPPRLAGLLGHLTRPRPSERPPSADAALRELEGEGARDPRQPPRLVPRGALRPLRAGLRRARAGESVLLQRRVPGESARRALLCRAATEGIRAGFLPLRPSGAGGAPPRPVDLTRLLRARGLVAPARSWRRGPDDHGAARSLPSALADAGRAAGCPLLLLVDGAGGDPGAWREIVLPCGTLLLLLLGDEAAYNSGP